MTDPPFRFRLYVAGAGPNSLQAQANLKRICQERLPDCFAMEVVDVFLEPQRALADGVFLTPTLILPELPSAPRLVGNLHDEDQLLHLLGLE